MRRATVKTPHSLADCPKCGKDTVYPEQWEEIGETHWRMWLRCGGCQWEHEGVYDNATAEAFDERLDELAAVLEKDADAVTAWLMREEVDKFAFALGRDLILPEDF